MLLRPLGMARRVEGKWAEMAIQGNLAQLHLRYGKDMEGNGIVHQEALNGEMAGEEKSDRWRPQQAIRHLYDIA